MKSVEAAAPTSAAASVTSAESALPATLRVVGTALTSAAASVMLPERALPLTVRVVGTASVMP